MKTAVSIPDDLFRSAEKLAKRRKLSRSRLYAEALRKYLKLEREQRLAEQMNAVCRELDTSLDPAMRAAAARTVARSEW